MHTSLEWYNNNNNRHIGTTALYGTTALALRHYGTTTLRHYGLRHISTPVKTRAKMIFFSLNPTEKAKSTHLSEEISVLFHF